MVVWPLGGPFLGPDCPKWPFLGPKKSVFFGQKSIFCPHPPISSLPSWPDTKKFLCRSCCWASSWGAARAHFWPKDSPKIRFFYATPIKSLFFGLRRTWLNEIITSTYPEVTLDTFIFRKVAIWLLGRPLYGPNCLKWPFLGPKMHIIPLYRMASYGTA